MRVVEVECPNDCKRFGGKVPGHVYGSNWSWVPCQTCGGSSRVDACARCLGRRTVPDSSNPTALDYGYRNPLPCPDCTT